MATLSLDDRGVLMPCPSCGKMNRLRYAALDRTPRCGQCGKNLPPPSSPIEVPSAGAFDALIAASPIPVVVDFWAPWCGPCRMVVPELEKVARNTAGDYLIVKVNTDAVPELGDRFGIRSIPTMAVFREGREVARTAGARPAMEIHVFIRHALSPTHA